MFFRLITYCVIPGAILSLSVTNEPFYELAKLYGILKLMKKNAVRVLYLLTYLHRRNEQKYCRVIFNRSLYLINGICNHPQQPIFVNLPFKLAQQNPQIFLSTTQTKVNCDFMDFFLFSSYVISFYFFMEVTYYLYGYDLVKFCKYTFEMSNNNKKKISRETFLLTLYKSVSVRNSFYNLICSNRTLKIQLVTKNRYVVYILFCLLFQAFNFG